MTNFEIKAKIDNIDKYGGICKKISARHIWSKKQVDTYFNVPSGRLKLREAGKGTGELIYYRRQEKMRKRWSNYDIAAISDPTALKKLLTTAYGVKIVVDKQRSLYKYKNARIHLDQVKRLGSFLEIEVVVKKSTAQARVLMESLLLILNIPKNNFVKESYSDLLHRKYRLISK